MGKSYLIDITGVNSYICSPKIEIETDTFLKILIRDSEFEKIVTTIQAHRSNPILSG
jgi:hypothetical protein